MVSLYDHAKEDLTSAADDGTHWRQQRRAQHSSNGSKGAGKHTATNGKNGDAGTGSSKHRWKGDTGGKGKGKGKGGKNNAQRERQIPSQKTPEYWGFKKLGTHTYVRDSQLPVALCLSDPPFLEIGNLEHDPLWQSSSKNAELDEQAGSERLTTIWTTGFAGMEVLCNNMVIFGNPFKVSYREDFTGTQHNATCDAYDEFLDEILDPVSSSKHEALCQAADIIGKKHGLEQKNILTEWMRTFGHFTPGDFQAAFQELKGLVQKRHDEAYDSSKGWQLGAGSMTRLVCRCVPKRCHAQTLAKRLGQPEASIQESSAAVTSVRSEPQAGNSTSSRGPRPARNKCPQREIGSSSAQPPPPPPPPPAPPLPSPPQRRAPPTDRRAGHFKKSSGPPPWGDRWGAAGIVALQRRANCDRVCLVEKRNGRLGFPKGRAESCDSSALQTALREWREEAMLPEKELIGLRDTRLFVDSWGCHYFYAEWTGECADEPSTTTTWEVQDDILDDDPIVLAHWMPCREALQHRMLAKDRKDVLRRAMQDICAVPAAEAATAADTNSERQPRRWRNKATSSNAESEAKAV